jgi:hypothetical protein
VTKENFMIANVQAHRPAPAPLVPAFKQTAGRIGRAIWIALHAVGAARARAELLRVAASAESTNPQLAAQLRRVAREDFLTQS